VAAKTESLTSGTTSSSPRVHNLALIFQELLTAIVRLRSGRQDVASAEAFRNQVLAALKAADGQGKGAGYTDEDVQLAEFAVVAFLDESILNQRKAIFKDWVRRPLQEELFGRHVAGELFFENLQRILGRRDATETADLLEVYYLCILLGYLGRYSISSKADLRALMQQIEEKIQRIRKQGPDISPQWRLPQETGGFALFDPWIRRLTIALLVIVSVTFIGFVVYKLDLGTRASDLNSFARGLR
jgi:type VI secretion system protein ImpK